MTFAAKWELQYLYDVTNTIKVTNTIAVMKTSPPILNSAAGVAYTDDGSCVGGVRQGSTNRIRGDRRVFGVSLPH